MSVCTTHYNYHQLAGIGWLHGTLLQWVEWLVVLSFRNRVGKHFTFCKCPTTQLLAAEWGKVTLSVLNLEELCPVHVYHLDKLCPTETEGLCPDDLHRALRLQCLIQSVWTDCSPCEQNVKQFQSARGKWQFSSARGTNFFIEIPLHRCWAPQVRSVSSFHCCITLPIGIGAP